MTLKLVKTIQIIYQSLTKSQIRTCRYDPTCSEYFVKAVEKYGFLKGAFKAAKRISSCHPFSQRPLYDPA